MAIGSSNIRSVRRGSQDALLKQLLEEYGAEATPKVKGLSRILAPLSGIGSIIDAYYDATVNEGDAGILNVLKNYGQNIAQGIGTLITGTNYEKDLRSQGASELLEELNPEFSTSAIGSSPVGRILVDIAGGMLTDPTTFFSFGAASLADDIIKGGLKAADVTGDVAKKILPKLTGGTLDDITKTLAKEIGPDAADKFYVNIMQNVGKSTAKSGALKLFGKTISESPTVVKATKGVVSPLGAAMDQLGAASKKFTPELRASLLDIFDPVQGAVEKGYGDEALNLLKFNRQASSVDYDVLGELQESGLLKHKGISKKDWAKMPEYIEASKKVGGKLSTPENLPQSVKDYIGKYFDFEEGFTKKMQELGLPTINPEEMGYIMRTPIGYKKKILKSTLAQSGMEGEYERILGNKNVIKDLDELGYVRRDTLKKALGENSWAAFKQYEPGTLGELIEKGGATKSRVFPTLKEAKAAGLVYGENPLENLYTQTVRQKGQLLAAQFAQDMVSNENLFSKEAKGVLTTPITIPGVGRFYTDKHMAKIAEDYVSKYTTQEGVERLLGSFDEIQRTWRKFVTGMGPNAIPYNIRNLLDDNIRLVVDGADVTKLPDDYKLSIDLFKYQDLVDKFGKKEALKRIDQSRAAKFLKEVGVDAENPIDELWNRVVKNGVLTEYTKAGTEMGLGMPVKVREALEIGEPERLQDRLAQEFEDKVTLGGKLNRREQSTRMATFFNNWRKEGTQSAGLDAVARVSFNYNELTKTEREVLKRVIPFYGFVKNNLKFYLGLLKDNPEKLARYYNVYEGLQSGSQGLYKEEWEALPDYLKETLTIPIGKTDEGELKYLTGINLGIEKLGDISPDTTGLRSAAENLSPGLSMLIELISGKDLFTGQDILEGNQGAKYANRSELLKKLMNYQEYPVDLGGGKTYTRQTVAPTWKYALENTPFIGTANTSLNRLSGLRSKEGVSTALTSLLSPAKIGKMRVDTSEEAKQKKQLEELYKLLQRKGMADTYKTLYIPEGLREQLLK